MFKHVGRIGCKDVCSFWPLQRVSAQTFYLTASGMCLQVAFVMCAFFFNVAIAATPAEVARQHPFYVGFTQGYGSTTWNQIVPTRVNQIDAMLLSTPIHAAEGGYTWGVLIGYELLPEFAVELSYIRYPEATVYFSPLSLFTFDHDGTTQFTSRTDVATLVAKIMFYIPRTKIRVFSSVGPAILHRNDFIENRYRISPAFATGFNYPLSEHVMIEFAFNYVAGYGESELNPVEDYMPFLYAGMVTLSYRI